MLYLDTSVLVKIYVEEDGSIAIREQVNKARFVATSMIAYVEARAAFALIRGAATLAEKHSLRAYDAIHLASATLLRTRAAEAILFGSWNANLGNAARREGLELLS
jgi:uncharacterized protein